MFTLQTHNGKDGYWWSTSSGKIELHILPEHIEQGYHQGDCTDSVNDLCKDPHLSEQLAEVNIQLAIQEMEEYGFSACNLQPDCILSTVLFTACGDLFDAV